MSGAVPKATSHPNAFAWFVLVTRFSVAIRETWAGGAAAGGKAGKQENKKEEAAAEAGKGKKAKGGKKGKPAKEEEEDEMDLFGEDNEEDKVCKWTLFKR